MVVAVGWSYVEADADVGDDSAVLADEYRVQVKLGDLGDVLDHGTDPVQDLGERRHVQRGGLAVSGEQPVGAQRAEHLIYVGVAEGGDAHRDVFEDLDERAAQADQDEGAEGGVVGHADDHFDAVADLLLDQEFRGVLHVGAVTLPALFAAAETMAAPTIGSFSGRDLLRAAVAGYEVGPRVGMCMGQEHIGQGWHSGATVGVFSAASGASAALGLSAEQTVHALGIAGTQSAGLMAAQYGAMVK